MSIRHGNPGEWAKVNGTVISLWPLYCCCVVLGACGASIAFGKFPLWFAAGFAGAIVALAFFWRKGLRRVESYFKGASGEERVATVLDGLSEKWHVFHDFEVGAFHVDHVVVGPTGVYSVETKNWSGRVTLEEGELLVEGRPADRAPLAQTLREAEAVKTELLRAGWTGEVTPVLCFASDTFAEGQRTAGRVTVLNLAKLVAWLSERGVVLPPNELERLTRLMTTRERRG